MDYIAYRPAEPRPDLTNYVICHSCYCDPLHYYKTQTWDRELWRWISNDWVPIHTNDMGLTCWRCHSKITGPEWPAANAVPKKRSWCRKRQKYHADTRRVSSSGKLIGGHTGHTWHGDGKYCKRMLHKAERQYWKRVSKVSDSEYEPRISLRGFGYWSSVVCWKND